MHYTVGRESNSDIEKCSFDLVISYKDISSSHPSLAKIALQGRTKGSSWSWNFLKKMDQAMV